MAASCTGFACKEKAAPPPPVLPQASTIVSGIYMSAQAGDCLCVNSEKKIAGLTSTLAAMSINLGKGYDESQVDDMKEALREKYKELKLSGKDNIKDGNTIYVKVAKAEKCQALNHTIEKPISYDSCLE